MTQFSGYGRDDEVSFEAFASGSATRLMRSAYLLCGNRHTAEDLLQMTLMRTARRWRAARSAPEAYARAVLVNLARDHARRGQRRVNEVPADGSDLTRAPGGPMADHAEAVADRDAVLAALAALPQRQREVVVLRFYADLSVTDTAAAIGASPGTVMSYTSRALTRLRQLLDDPFANGNVPTKAEVPHESR